MDEAKLIFSTYFYLSSVTLSGLWGLVNNAGIFYALAIEWAPLDNFKRTADVNLWGMIDVTKTFLPLVKKARGRVVNFSSVAGKKTMKHGRVTLCMFFVSLFLTLIIDMVT